MHFTDRLSIANNDEKKNRQPRNPSTQIEIDMVDAIQACVELDIPLKEYLNFTEDKGQTIHAEALLYFYKEDTVKRYHFIEIMPTENTTEDKNIITLPAGYVIAKTATPDKIEQAELEFPELFAKNSINTVILSELLTENIDVNNLPYELKCYSH